MEKTETALTPDEVVEILDSFVADVTPHNPRFAEALELAALWLSVTDVREAIYEAGL